MRRKESFVACIKEINRIEIVFVDVRLQSYAVSCY